ncbi:MAG: YjbE family putative metal transport protein [Parvularculaceae bacterium]
MVSSFIPAAVIVPRANRGKAIAIGIIAATLLRIVFALLTTTLLAITGLLFAGGVLLLWVCWKMGRELIETRAVGGGATALGSPPAPISTQQKTLSAAILQIVIADISMSLDNVLAVAGAAHDHPSVLIFGLTLSIMLMGFAATFIAGLLERHRWIAYAGLAVILLVAGEMIWRGGKEIWSSYGASLSSNEIVYGGRPPHVWR